MNISLIGPVYPYRGGIAHYTGELSRRLTDSGHHVQVSSFRRQYPSWLYPGQTDRDPSNQAFQQPVRFHLDPLYPWTWFSEAREIASSGPRIVLISWWTTFWGPAFTAMGWYLQQKGIHPVFLIHNVLPHEQKPWDRSIASLALRQAGAFIAQSRSQDESLRELLRQPVIYHCPHPVYPEFEGCAVSKEDARRQLGLPDCPIILFFGIVRPYKGLAQLVKALSQLTDAAVVVAGEFWESKEAYVNLADDYCVRDRLLIFNRYIPSEEVPLFFRSADVFCAPYQSGTQSGAVKAAIGYGLPLVLTDVIADDIILQLESRARIVPAGDVDQLAAALQASLHTSSASAGEIRQLVESSWRDMVDVIEQIAANE